MGINNKAASITARSPPGSLHILTSRADASIGSASPQTSDLQSTDSDDMPPLDPSLINELVQQLFSDLSSAGFYINHSPRATGIKYDFLCVSLPTAIIKYCNLSRQSAWSPSYRPQSMRLLRTR